MWLRPGQAKLREVGEAPAPSPPRTSERILHKLPPPVRSATGFGKSRQLLRRALTISETTYVQLRCYYYSSPLQHHHHQLSTCGPTTSPRATVALSTQHALQPRLRTYCSPPATPRRLPALRTLRSRDRDTRPTKSTSDRLVHGPWPGQCSTATGLQPRFSTQAPACRQEGGF